MLPMIAFSQVFLISNYPLKKNNFEKSINQENYRYMVDVIKNLEDVKDVYLMETDEGIYIYIDLYPTLKKINIEGNRAIWREEILSYLGFYEGMPFKEVSDEDIAERLRRLYKDKGFLDAHVAVTKHTDNEGNVFLYIGIDEGPVYFTIGGFYEGASYPAEKLDEVAQIVKGTVISEGDMWDKVFLLQDFYTKEGYIDAFVYYEGLRKTKLNKPLLEVLLPADPSIKKKPLRIFGGLSKGISNLFRHPLGTLLAITGKGYGAGPSFKIIEGAKYIFEFKGAVYFSPEELTRISGLREKGVDPFSLEEAKENIIKAYMKKGFFDVSVSYAVEGKRVAFTIEEGERYRMLRDGSLEGFYDEDILEQELRKTLEKLRIQGYTLAEGRILKDIDRTEKIVRVDLEIMKGKKQILKAFIYEGSNKELRKIFKKHNEKLPRIYSSDLVEKLNLDIEAYFKREGFMEGDYGVDVKIQEEEDSIYYSYIYRVVEGPRYKLGQTLYYGYDKTTTRELSYMTRFSKHYSSNLDEESLYNFLNSGIFGGVSIDTFVDKNRKEVHRLIQLSEDKRGIFDLSLGYNTEEKISIDTFVGVKNLFGISLEASVRYRKTSKYELYNIELQDRFFLSRKYWFKYDIFRNREEHKSFDLDVKGLNLQLGYRITPYTSVGAIFNISTNTVFATDYNLRKYGIFLLREYKDNPFVPKRIHYNSLTLLRATGDLEYTKGELATFYLIPIKESLKFSFKVSGGYASKSAPIFERFFLGGLKNLRGYSYEEVGQPNGGRYYIFTRGELLIDIREPFVWVVFGDAGSVAGSVDALRKGFKKDAGIGLGVNTPVGPIRLDVAFPIEKDGIKRFKLYLSVGYYY